MKGMWVRDFWSSIVECIYSVFILKRGYVDNVNGGIANDI